MKLNDIRFVSCFDMNNELIFHVVWTVLVAVYTPVLWLYTPPPTPTQIPDQISIGRCEKETICALVRCWFLMGIIRTLNTQSYMYIVYMYKTCIYSVWCLVSLVVSLPQPSPSY